MKAFFSRLHLGGGKDKEKDNVISKEKFPPLRQWPPSREESSRATSTPTSYTSFKPLPELVPELSDNLVTRAAPPTDDQISSSSTTPTPSSPVPSSHHQQTTSVSATSEVQKKVAFISPPPTPGPSLARPLPQSPTPQPASAPNVLSPPKNSVSRFHAAHGKEPRGSTSSGTRTASPSLPKPDMSTPSLRSGSPYSQMSENTSGSRILAATSWSEVAEDDLVSNIGSRERTRQEVLFEIIQSEERYVQELVKMKDTFIDPLLHPFASPSTSSSPLSSSTPNLDYDYERAESPLGESSDNLPPIAARFMSPTPPTPLMDADTIDSDEDDEEADDRVGKGYASPTSRQQQAAKHNHPRSPYRSTVTRTAKSVPFPSGSRSHHSLPAPPPRTQQLTSSTQSLGRQSTAEQASQSPSSKKQQSPAMLRKFKKSDAAPASNPFGDVVAPHQLPDDLRICLQVIDSGVLDGHKRLSEALKKRYDDQYPLVRSLADVFVFHADIFHGYATYVLHLERALAQADNALSNISTKKPKNQDMAEWNKVCRYVQKLEEIASDKGETGLAITLSKPFQRLLKYPLLFQNLLFHTDPSTFEYESTLQMVAEVETIVRSIEDEKIQKEERDRTRDVFARIEGLDKVKQLALPKPSRLLVDERQIPVSLSPLKSPTPSGNPKVVKGRSSLRKISDVLGGQKKELWLVAFNDVVLQCQKTGTTSLPMIAATNSRTNSLPDLQGKAKYATTGRRNSHTKPRNLYKFIKIETWAIGDVALPREGVVSMEDVARTRSQLSQQPRIVPMPEDKEDDEDGAESDDSDRKSKMSFSYWGADKVTVQKPVLGGKGRLAVAHPRRGGGPAYARESSANAKFGSRLVSEGSGSTPRPASRRTGTNSRQGEYSVRSTSTKPEWNTSTRSPALPAKNARARNLSQTSGAVTLKPAGLSTNGVGAVKLASPAPSEDSGVGLYRQMLAKDPSLNNA